MVLDGFRPWATLPGQRLMSQLLWGRPVDAKTLERFRSLLHRRRSSKDPFRTPEPGQLSLFPPGPPTIERLGPRVAERPGEMDAVRQAKVIAFEKRRKE